MRELVSWPTYLLTESFCPCISVVRMIVDTGGDCGLMEEHLCFCDGAEQRTGDGMV